MRVVVAVAIFVLLAFFARAPAAHAQEEPDADREQTRTALYREGLALADAGRWKEAVERFRQVVAIRSAPKAVFTLAQAEEQSGALATAQRTYGRARADASQAGDAAVFDAAEEAMRALGPRVPRVVIDLDPASAAAQADARATVDGLPAALGDPVPLDVGRHVVAVEAPKMHAFVENVDVVASQTLHVTATLAPIETREAERPGEPPPARRAPAVVGPLVLGAAGLVAAAVGFGVRVAGQSDYDDAARQCTNVACSSVTASAGNDARDRMLAGTVTLAVGAAALATAGVWWFVDRRGGPQRAAAPVPARFVARRDACTLDDR